MAGNIFSKDGTYPSNPTNMPMLGKISDGNISFKCLGGLAVIRVASMPAASGTLTVTADQQLSGKFFINWSTTEIATTTSSEGSNTVTFSFSNATKDGVGVFYLPLAVGDYTNLTIKVTYGETTQIIPYGSLTVTCANVTAIPLSTDSKGNLRHIVNNGDGSYTINGQKFIDLGLSVLWAETNIGADSELGYGNYYSWGETTTKSSYTTGTYTYTESPETLPADHDAATANWGSTCRMPTYEEFAELVNGSDCTWTTENGGV